jgi:DNA-binding XRE family transcriptional regulator
MTKDSQVQLRANEALIQARARQGWTEKDVADQIGVDKRTYSRWEKGQLQPRLRHIRVLCELFHTAPEMLGFNLDEMR